jgi:hypothetical protein
MIIAGKVLFIPANITGTGKSPASASRFIRILTAENPVQPLST